MTLCRTYGKNWGLDYEWLNQNFGIDEVLQKRYLNDYFQGFAGNSASRYLHRGRMKWELSEHKDDLEIPEGKMFCGLSALIGLRGTCPAFGTAADVWTLDTGDDGLLAVGRYAKGQKIIGVFNFTEWEKTVTFPHDLGRFTDMLTGGDYLLQNLPVPAYGFYYLEQRSGESKYGDNY